MQKRKRKRLLNFSKVSGEKFNISFDVEEVEKTTEKEDILNEIKKYRLTIFNLKKAVRVMYLNSQELEEFENRIKNLLNTI